MGQSVIRNPRKVHSQSGGDPSLPSRVTTLENNEYKVTYYEIISGASGSLTVPTGATINAGEFGLSGNCILSKIDGSNKPTFESPKTSGGTIVTASLNETTGAWVASGTYTDSFVALIYSIKIKAVDYSNLTYANIIETVKLNTLNNYGIIQFSHTTLNPADGTTYFFGSNVVANSTNTATTTLRRGFSPCDGFVYGGLINVQVSSTLGSNETATFKINNKTQATSVTISTSVKYDVIAAGFPFTITNGFAVNSGDSLEIEFTTPTFATNPVSVIHLVALYISL
jgi:hypothetical protein